MRNVAAMRRLFSFLACLVVFAGPAAAAAETTFVRIWPEWRAAESFERIGEYFGAPEHRGREIVIRTRADQRAGFYFLVRVKQATPLAGARFALHMIRPDAPEVVAFTFPVASAPAGESVYLLGLTGTDWPGGKNVQPVAWKLELLSADDRALTDPKSFLWEKPAT